MISSPQSSDAAPRLSRDELKARLDEIFYLDLDSSRSVEPLLDAIGLLPRAKQDFALHWGKVAARSSMSVAYLLVRQVPAALQTISVARAERWVLAALDDYDRSGAPAAMAILRDCAGFSAARASAVVKLGDIAARLGHFAQGLSGRALKISADAQTWSDGMTLHLPAEIASADAIDRYKALIAVLWAQERHGTFALDLDVALAGYGDGPGAATWLALLEALRVGPRVAADLPGLNAALRDLLAEMPATLDEFRDRLADAQATVADSLACLPHLVKLGPPADAMFGALRPAAVQQARAQRIANDTVILRKAIAGLMAAVGNAGQGETAVDIAVAPGGVDIEMRMDGEVVVLPMNARAAARSLLQDLGAIPPEWLVAAGPGPWHPTAQVGDGVALALTGAADAVYDEWDYQRGAYRHQWCHVYLRPLPPGDPAYVGAVRQRRAPLIRQIRRRFEALRGEDRMLRRQSDGPEIDLDALVEAIADRRGGAEPASQLFRRRQRNERSLATCFLVDMSGSTKGWVNDAEREALVMLCEALETLGDRYAIWGFSGWTRSRCELYRIKDFDDAYDHATHGRIAAIEAKDYTRMGPPIRHLAQQLLREPAKHRLLVTLSDGRPDDFGDEYRGQYGVEDTRQALLEARDAGVRAYCVTIDRHGADYLKRMYGPAKYTVLADVEKLPLRIADIYRKLTS